MKKNKEVNITYVASQRKLKELRDIYGDEYIQAVEKEIITKEKRITSKNNNFIITKQMSIIIRNNRLKKLGFTYFGYLTVLGDSLDYSNKINFNTLKEFGVSEPMIKAVRKKLKDTGIIKKYGNDFYLNPNIAQKGDSIPDYVEKLFKNT